MSTIGYSILAVIVVSLFYLVFATWNPTGKITGDKKDDEDSAG